MHDESSTKALNIPEPDDKPSMFPCARAGSIEEYFNLPKAEREKWGIYLKPHSLPCDLFDEDAKGWGEFHKQIRKHYPIQGWIREWLWSYDNPVYAFIKHRISDVRDIKNNIRRFFRPSHPRFRKAYPRHVWMDITNAVVEVNFAMLQDFWHEEVYPEGFVDWHADPKTEEVYQWMQKAINWIEKVKPELEKKAADALSAAHKNRGEGSYEEIYGEHDKLEKMIDDGDTDILNKMIQYRAYFWT